MSDEQKAHDLALSYVNYVATTSGEQITPEDFYQDYENAFPIFLNLIKNYK